VGQPVEDIDLVLLAVFAQPPRIALQSGDGAPVGAYLLGSICAVIELKEHHRDAVALQGDTLVVRYGDQWKNAVDQNRKQMHALGDFLEAKGVTRPFIQKFIWLKNVEQRELSGSQGANTPAIPYLLFKDSTWASVLSSIWRSWRAKNPNAQGFGDDSYFISADISRRSPADFDSISYALTSEPLSLTPAVFEGGGYSSTSSDLHGRRPGQSSATGGMQTRRGPLSFGRILRLVTALLVLGLVAGLGSIMGLMNISRWMTTSPSVHTAPTTNARLLSAFAGRYRCQRKSQADLVTVSASADHLNISSGKGGAELWPLSENEFRSVNATTDFNGKAVFTRGLKGKVLNLIISSAEGAKVVCPRSE
jgi:hypothetical protein